MTRRAEESSARRVILEQFQLVAQIGGSARIDDILKKLRKMSHAGIECLTLF